MFIASDNGRKLPGQLFYIKSEYSFDFKPSRNADITLMLNFLYLGVDSETMLAQQVWGYNSYTTWNERDLIQPYYFVGELRLQELIEPGTSKRLKEGWSTSYDPKTGWICIGNEEASQNDIGVEFANNTVAIVNSGELKSIWLRPYLNE
ncbi:hypothetical protein BSK56_11790 [Paenibacillus borealis]|uniref:Uncharacterized protein n=1 Tax=Paenibacillus borealis TaxID=160799 RepID=A0ABX3HFQ5_PAEBO|nr:hypothetical protein [Paenibacillus borealis]OMD48447.1 hypothetical protein BSK56_11790 [Paenibacillus borealis]